MADSDYYPIYDLRFVTGDYVKRRVLFEDPDPDSPDPDNPIMIPRNLTGYTARAQVRVSTKRDATILATFDATVGEDDDPENGIIVIELQPEESARCVKTSGWDLELTDPDGHPETVLGGKVLPKLDYTR